jgi:hypothetical protein
MIAVFCGPTISAEEVQAHLPAQCHPPAARGDIYRVAREDRPRAIGLIDGFFQGALSVWHKEILWAMAQGIHVFGASSMGALRASELNAYGMHGVGQVFRAYRDGEIEDDDEVALVHGPAETGYAALSEPLVNIRATLAAAETAGVVDSAVTETLIANAKATFYQHLTWEHLLAMSGGDADQMAALDAWLPENKVDAKRDDAVEMLTEMSTFLQSIPTPCEVDYHFERTHLWDEVVADVANDPGKDVLWNGLTAAELLGALQAEPDLYARLRDLAVRRVVPEGAAVPVAERDVRQALTAFRQNNDLLTAAEFTDWLERRGWSEHALRQRLAQDIARNNVAGDHEAEVNAEILEQLRMSPEFDAVLARARALQLTTQTTSDVVRVDFMTNGLT